MGEGGKPKTRHGTATAQGGGIRANICHSFGDPSRRRENDVDGDSRLSSVGSQAKRAVTPVNIVPIRLHL